MPKMAATTPISPVAPETYTVFAEPDLAVDEAELPLEVPDATPLTDASSPLQV